MIDDARVERALPEILGNLGHAPAPDYADLILGTTVRTRQRPAWAFPEGWVPARFAWAGVRSGSLSWQPVVVLALLLVALVVSSVLAIGTTWRNVLPPFGPARNGDIAYSANGDIFSVDPVSGTERALLPSSQSADSDPWYSPDGRLITFKRASNTSQEHTTDVVVMNADGSGDHLVNTTPLPDEPPWTVWAPDSRTLLIVTSPRGDAVVETFDASQRGLPYVISTPGIQPQQVSFQPPDGRQLLVRGKQGYGIGLWTMNADGSGVRTIVAPFETWSREDLRSASWSPDGAHVLYQLSPNPAAGARLFIANADGSGAREVAAAAGGLSHAWGVWSPDSTRIVFERLLVDDTFTSPRRSQLAVVTVADDQVVDVGPELEGWPKALWSPDGTNVLVLPENASHPVPSLLLDPAGGPPIETDWGADGGGDWQRKAP